MTTHELAFPQDEDSQSLLGIIDTEVRPEQVERLNPYLATAAELQEAQNPAQAAKILSTLSKGLSTCATLLAAASFHMNQSRSARKKAEAIVALDEFPKHVAAQKKMGIDLKSTDKVTEHFINQHPLVLEAKEREAFFEALYEKLVINKSTLTMAISSARAIGFGYKDINSMSSSAIPAE